MMMMMTMMIDDDDDDDDGDSISRVKVHGVVTGCSLGQCCSGRKVIKQLLRKSAFSPSLLARWKL